MTPTQKKTLKTLFGYKGRTFRFRQAETAYIDGSWSGGSKDYALMLHRNGQVQDLAGIIGDIKIQDDTIVAVHSYFCGKDCGITVYGHGPVALEYSKEV